MYRTFLKQHILATCLLVAVLMTGCSSTRIGTKHLHAQRLCYEQLSPGDRALADTIIKNVLDNEGLFTVIGRLKPISSAGDIYIRTTDTAQADYQKMQRYQRVVNALQFRDLGFTISSFKMHEDGRRTLQINIYRRSLVDSMILANSSFYRKLGFLPGNDARLVINTTEYEDKLLRFRSYGNLFGYPPHAVDFFVSAEQTKEQTGKFVERDFYQIPVHSASKGHFVYALPKNSKPNEADSAIRGRAAFYLQKYREIRKKYAGKDSTLNAYRLLQHLIKRVEK